MKCGVWVITLILLFLARGLSDLLPLYSDYNSSISLIFIYYRDLHLN